MVTTNKTAEQIVNTDPGPVDDLVQAALGTQSWFQKYSNEVTTGFFGLLQVLGLVIGLGVELPPWAVISTAAVIFVANLVGITKTPNGLTPANAAQLKAIEDYLGKRR